MPSGTGVYTYVSSYAECNCVVETLILSSAVAMVPLAIVELMPVCAVPPLARGAPPLCPDEPRRVTVLCSRLVQVLCTIMAWGCRLLGIRIITIAWLPSSGILWTRVGVTLCRLRLLSFVFRLSVISVDRDW